MSDWLPRLFVRRLVLLWVVIITSMVIFWFMEQPTVNEHQAYVVEKVLILLGVVTAFYTHKRHQDSE